MEWADEDGDLRALRARVAKLQKASNGDMRISELKTRRKSTYALNSPHHTDESKNIIK